MRLRALLYLVGFALVLLGERLVGGDDPLRWTFDGVGVLAVVSCVVLLYRAFAAAPADQKRAHKLAFVFALVGVAALPIYALTTDKVVDAFHFADADTEQRYTVALTVLWLIVWVSGTLPMLAIDRAIAVSPIKVVPDRIREAGLGGLSAALALAMLFPINFVAKDMNKRWDLGYFKTSEPGTSIRNIVQNLSEPITAYLFFPDSSEVKQEVRGYFDAIAGPTLIVKYVDHALEPELAKDLKVRDNGYVVLVRGEGDDRQVERIRIGTDFDSAKRELKRLDEKIQGKLIELAKGKRTAYVTVGHGEMYWRAGKPQDERIDTVKKVLRTMNFKVEELGAAQGLATEVPEDADLVMVFGPTKPFLPSEVAALDAYRKRGGALLVALEPVKGTETEPAPDLSALLEPVGIEYDASRTLASDKAYVVRTYKKADRVNIATNKFSTHESVTTLSRNSGALFVVAPDSGVLEEDRKKAEGSVKSSVTVRSLPEVWADADGDLLFEPATEKRKSWPLAIAVSGPAPDAPMPEASDDGAAENTTADAGEGEKAKDEDDKDGSEDAKKKKDAGDTAGSGKLAEYRMVVFADAMGFSDFFMQNQGNLLLLLDTVNWLTHEESSQGTVNSEEDVKIQHTKEGQGWWFYSTAFVVPLGLLGGGLLRVRARKKRGAA